MRVHARARACRSGRVCVHVCKCVCAALRACKCVRACVCARACGHRDVAAVGGVRLAVAGGGDGVGGGGVGGLGVGGDEPVVQQLQVPLQHLRKYRHDMYITTPLYLYENNNIHVIIVACGAAAADTAAAPANMYTP